MLFKLVILVLTLNAVFVHGAVNICWNYKKNQHQEKTPNGLESSGSDTMKIEHFELNFTHPAISMDLIFDNLLISNWSTVNASPFKDGALVNLTISNIYLEGNYDMFGNIGELFDIFGKGPFWMSLHNFSVAVFPELYVNASSICVPVRVDLVLQSIEVRFSNFMEDEDTGDLINKALCSMIPNMIEYFWDDIKKGREPEIENWINGIINGNPTMEGIVEREIERIIDSRVG